MCGICGVVDFGNSGLINKDMLSRMCAELRHRGPDDEGIFIDTAAPQAGLGHRRLSIIDLSQAGHQPLTDENKTLQLIFNGEIYNYQELKADLEKNGHKFSSQTDSETIIHLYQEYGQDCLRHLRGMFAFALWDTRKKTLLLARDRVGKKPLLYHFHNNRFVFASEFCSLLASGLINRQINNDAVDYYLSFGYIPVPLTIYSGVFKLPPAHIAVIKDNKLTLKKYWQLDYSDKINISQEEAASETLRLLKEAVKIRLHSDVPLGAFLSGGIDSSAVVALMSELSEKKVRTFSIGFAEGDYNELRFARNIAERFGTEHNEFIVKPRALEILPLLVERYGEPYADSSCIPTYYVSQQTRRQVTVSLNGDGGDESFAGYERYQGMLAAEAYNNLASPFKKTASLVARCLPDSLNPKNRIRNIKRFLLAAGLPPRERYLRWVGIFDGELKNAVYSEAFREKLSADGASGWISVYLDNRRGVSILDRVLEADVNTYLLNDLLVKVDITSMANSLEARSPFLDHKLMEFAARLPAEYKIRGLVKKYILRKAIKGLVPPENVNRRKMGFGVPVGEWLRGELKPFLEETLLSKASLNRGYFKPKALRQIITKHTKREADYSMQIWALLMLELWHRRFAG